MIEQRTIVKTTCPADIMLPIPSAVDFAADAVVDASAAAIAGLRAHFERERLLEQRLIDARSQCPHD